MPKIFELPQVRNNQPRNGFDLSQRHLFTASVGQLIPVLSELCVPGDNFRIDTSVFTRTVTMRRANFARFKEYVDFFFVPLKSIWRFAPEFLVNIENDSTSYVADYNNNVTIYNAPSFEPLDLFNTMVQSDGSQYDTIVDDLGFSWVRGANKLLDMLGYGSDLLPNPNVSDFNYRKAELKELGLVNLWKPAAYQAIYQNFYRNTDWERSAPLSYNFDYLHNANTVLGSNRLTDVGSKYSVYQQLFQMRYADYAKDLFIGLKPSTQFGDVAVVSSLIDRDQSLFNVNGLPVSRISDLSSSVTGKLRMGTQPYEFVRLQTQYSILDQRRAEALQRWKEIHLSAKKNYKDQIERIYNVNVPDIYADVINYVGGFTNLVNVQDVTSTAGTDTDSLGDLAGKGIGATSGETINFKAPVHGVFMAIYHVKPIAEYSSFMLDKQNSIVAFEDYYNPLFGNIGLEGVRRLQISQMRGRQLGVNVTEFENPILGYTARYIEYKTALDKAHGRFSSIGDLADWTLTLDPYQRLKKTLNYNSEEQTYTEDYNIDFTSLKAIPSDTDGVFVAQNDTPAITDDSTDPFYVAVQFDFKAIRPMDVDGMPY